MTSRPLCAATLSCLAILLCSCSDGGTLHRAEDSSEPPDIAIKAAPGVAFNFNYDFSLPDRRISAAQEAHAQACEKLGLAKCRITGMTYSVDQDEQVSAELNLKLDPAIARQFGKSAQQLVESSDGKLIRLNIGSSDEGEKIAVATGQQSGGQAQLARLEQELAKTKPGTPARAELMRQIQALQQQASAQRQTVEASQAVLASTPMAFHYYGRGGIPGFRGNPLREAWQTFVGTLVTLARILLQGIAILIPLGLLIAALVALWRIGPVRRLRRWFRGTDEASD